MVGTDRDEKVVEKEPEDNRLNQVGTDMCAKAHIPNLEERLMARRCELHRELAGIEEALEVVRLIPRIEHVAKYLYGKL